MSSSDIFTVNTTFYRPTNFSGWKPRPDFSSSSSGAVFVDPPQPLVLIHNGYLWRMIPEMIEPNVRSSPPPSPPINLSAPPTSSSLRPKVGENNAETAAPSLVVAAVEEEKKVSSPEPAWTSSALPTSVISPPSTALNPTEFPALSVENQKKAAPVAAATATTTVTASSSSRPGGRITLQELVDLNDVKCDAYAVHFDSVLHDKVKKLHFMTDSIENTIAWLKLFLFFPEEFFRHRVDIASFSGDSCYAHYDAAIKHVKGYLAARAKDINIARLEKNALLMSSLAFFYYLKYNDERGLHDYTQDCHSFIDKQIDYDGDKPWGNGASPLVDGAPLQKHNAFVNGFIRARKYLARRMDKIPIDYNEYQRFFRFTD
jgi:hypothetical protein